MCTPFSAEHSMYATSSEKARASAICSRSLELQGLFFRSSDLYLFLKDLMQFRWYFASLEIISVLPNHVGQQFHVLKLCSHHSHCIIYSKSRHLGEVFISIATEDADILVKSMPFCFSSASVTAIITFTCFLTMLYQALSLKISNGMICANWLCICKALCLLIIFFER